MEDKINFNEYLLLYIRFLFFVHLTNPLFRVSVNNFGQFKIKAKDWLFCFYCPKYTICVRKKILFP